MNLELSFKGTRKYLHGSDFYNSINDLCESKYSKDSFVSKISFRSLASKQCVVLFETPSVNEKLIGNGLISVSSAEMNSIPFWLVESDKKVSGRYPFDEDALVGNSLLNLTNKSITIQPNGEYTVIEEIIVLTKELNNQVCSVDGKWLFGQLDLKTKLPDSADEIAVVLSKMISGRFSVNDIYINNIPMGKIQFIVGKA
ncbi:hypothetical protein [Neptuniibacter marinus]|uniref:hypothetical protein n=1 Tax=Neptuniibacter marinus TaxID=1806670 RepID=UPI00082A9FB1|nr:hypothetical protein [Neptuniibacter marinus]